VIGYVAAGHKVIPPNRKNHRHTRSAAITRQTLRKRPAAGGLKLRSGYALPAFQPAGILILIDATLAASLSRLTHDPRDAECGEKGRARRGRERHLKHDLGDRAFVALDRGVAALELRCRRVVFRMRQPNVIQGVACGVAMPFEDEVL
jgi:hypothetical protein